MMDLRKIAVVRDYDGLHAALRARADELNLTREAIDNAEQLPDGYAGKLLAPEQVRAFGPKSLGALLSLFGLVLIVAEDRDALCKSEGRREQSVTGRSVKRRGSPSSAPATSE